jgi:hypothetical protein
MVVVPSFKQSIEYRWLWRLLFRSISRYLSGDCLHFDVSPHTESLLFLRQQLLKSEMDFADLSPLEMERTVGSILRDYLNMKVIHVGGPGDNGVDLLLLEGKEPLLGQVKRRKRAATEGVSIVREILGTLVLNRANKGILVSSANRFSADAKKAADDAFLVAGVKVDLYDQHRLREVLKLTHFPRSLGRECTPGREVIWQP